MDKGTLTVQFRKLGPHIGHYNAVLVDEQHQETSSDTSLQMAASCIQQASSGIKVKAHQILQLPQKSPIVLRRTSRCQQAELITSSPVKRRLQAQKSRARPGQAKQHPSKRARNGPQKKNDVDQEEEEEEEESFIWSTYIICRPWRPRLRPILVAIVEATR